MRKAVAGCLTRISEGGFHPDESLYEEVRRLTVETNKLFWMIHAAEDPQVHPSVFVRSGRLLQTARGSLFPRGKALLDGELHTVWHEKRQGAGARRDGSVASVSPAADAAAGNAPGAICYDPEPTECAEIQAPHPHVVFVLNKAIGMPVSCPTESVEAGADAELYLLDYNYLDSRKTSACLEALAQLAAAQHLDFSRKTLLLSIKGLHPGGAQLIELARQFRTHHVFFELWNGLREVAEICEAGIDNLYFLPVSSRVRQHSSAPLPAPPNGRVFVSLGGDDDLDLIRQVIALCPQLHFCVPDISWTKSGSEKAVFDVDMQAANVTPVDCSTIEPHGTYSIALRPRRNEDLTLSERYLAAYASCDVVLIATRADKMFHMRGGVRMADALYTRKHIVVTESPLLQLMMAQHEKTCLVAEHDAQAVAGYLTRICEGGFHADESPLRGGAAADGRDQQALLDDPRGAGSARLPGGVRAVR